MCVLSLWSEKNIGRNFNMKTTGQAVKVPMEVVYKPAWLTWIGSTTSCLNALGVDCDRADVAGMTGYAFIMSVHKELCPSGPTVFDWGSLLSGISALGRSTLMFQSIDCHTGDFKCDRTREHCRQVFELVRREIEAGRPCVLWGTYVPEFGVVYGIEGENYLVKTFKECMNEEQPPIPYDGIDAPGGPYMLGFPSKTEFKEEWYPSFEKNAIGTGVANLTKTIHFTNYAIGLNAYGQWIKALEENKAHVFGNAYNAQCWSEAKFFAHEFIAKLARKHEKVAKVLGKAEKHYDDVVNAMKTVSTLFPFPPGEQLKEESVRKEAIDALRRAKDSETLAVKALTESLDMDWS